ncbi:hypothetical protein H6P81_016300 [Aristolochia fimbriata]|uniref:Integral membrane bound transporter domain-containing protein n=1 Tax=Aristolochia fimbriata TaxID=158543 RepID=A0AAV7E7V1_ARIFI|nr:hypothetical protein H6P81_016300 [Aristolochia fimbriata]
MAPKLDEGILIQSSSSRTRGVWRSCLSSSLRTTLACAIVACAKYYGPGALRRHLALPALSYVTAVLIVTDATLGDAMHGALCTLLGTLQGVAPSAVVLWAVGPARFNITTATAAVALSAFAVALPESTHVVAKRVALLQIVVVYVMTFMHGAATDPVMHPLRVGVSSGVGALAALAAVFLPYPRLAYLQVRKTSKLFIKLSVERLRLFVNAFSAENNAAAAAYISQAKYSTKACNRLLQTLKTKQGSLQWESVVVFIGGGTSSSHGSRSPPSERLQALATPMKGMEMALTTSSPSFPLLQLIADDDSAGIFENNLQNFTNRISLRLMQLKHTYPHCRDSSTVVHESPDKSLQQYYSSFRDIIPNTEYLPSFFFLFCMNLLHDELFSSPTAKTNAVTSPVVDSDHHSGNKEDDQYYYSKYDSSIITQSVKKMISFNKRRIVIALRCSLTLGLSVLFGMLFSRGNGYWGGLVIASSMTPLREPTYRAANTRLQGTVLGTIYGLLGCYISQRLMEVRFIVLLPWFIFSGFLRRSRMYGPAGGVSAAVAAILIMGRKDYGSPADFASMRITETFISLACSLFVDLLLQPTRASSLARLHLSESFNALHENFSFSDFIKGKLPKLRGDVNELSKFADEATVEPNFWFLPFPGPAYTTLSGSLSKITDLLLFLSRAMEYLREESHRSGLAWKEIHETIRGDLELFRSLVSPSIKSLEEIITRIKSLEMLERDLQRNTNYNGSKDIESGKTPNAVLVHKSLCADGMEMEKVVASFLQHSGEVLNRVTDGDEEVKARMVMCMSALGYCMEGVMKEVRELEKGIGELVQWENPSTHVNLYEISCKIRDLSDVNLPA